MATRKFNRGNKEEPQKNDNAATTEVVEETPETAVAVQEETSVATEEHSPRVIANTARGLKGEYTPDDIIKPYLSLVGKSGDLSDEFSPGSFVFNKELELSDGSEKNAFEITVIEGERVFVEDLPFGDNSEAAVFQTEREMVAAGFHNNYDNRNDGKYCVKRGNFTVLIEVDKELEQFSLGKRSFALAAWVVQKTGYTSAGNTLINAALQGHLRNGFHLGSWKVFSKLKDGGDFKYYVPIVKRNGMHDKKFVEFIESEVLFD